MVDGAAVLQALGKALQTTEYEESSETESSETEDEPVQPRGLDLPHDFIAGLVTEVDYMVCGNLNLKAKGVTSAEDTETIQDRPTRVSIRSRSNSDHDSTEQPQDTKDTKDAKETKEGKETNEAKETKEGKEITEGSAQGSPRTPRKSLFTATTSRKSMLPIQMRKSIALRKSLQFAPEPRVKIEEQKKLDMVEQLLKEKNKKKHPAGPAVNAMMKLAAEWEESGTNTAPWKRPKDDSRTENPKNSRIQRGSTVSGATLINGGEVATSKTSQGLTPRSTFRASVAAVSAASSRRSTVASDASATPRSSSVGSASPRRSTVASRLSRAGSTVDPAETDVSTGTQPEEPKEKVANLPSKSKTDGQIRPRRMPMLSTEVTEEEYLKSFMSKEEASRNREEARKKEEENVKRKSRQSVVARKSVAEIGGGLPSDNIKKRKSAALDAMKTMGVDALADATTLGTNRPDLGLFHGLENMINGISHTHEKKGERKKGKQSGKVRPDNKQPDALGAISDLVKLQTGQDQAAALEAITNASGAKGIAGALANIGALKAAIKMKEKMAKNPNKPLDALARAALDAERAAAKKRREDREKIMALKRMKKRESEPGGERKDNEFKKRGAVTAQKGDADPRTTITTLLAPSLKRDAEKAHNKKKFFKPEGIEEPIWQRAEKAARERNDRIQMERLRREHQENELYTGTPQINEKSKAIGRATSVDAWLLKRDQKMKDMEATKATITMANCTFSPRLNEQSVRMYDAFRFTSEEVQDRILREQKEKEDTFAEKRKRILVEEFGETFSPTITNRAHAVQREGKIWDRLHANKASENTASPGQRSLSTPRKDKRATTVGWAAVGKSALQDTAENVGSENEGDIEIEEHDFTQHEDGLKAQKEAQEEVQEGWVTLSGIDTVDGVQVQALKYTPDLDSFVNVMELFSMPADKNGTEEEVEDGSGLDEDGIQNEDPAVEKRKSLTMVELAKMQEKMEEEARALKLAREAALRAQKEAEDEDEDEDEDDKDGDEDEGEGEVDENEDEEYKDGDEELQDGAEDGIGLDVEGAADEDVEEDTVGFDADELGIDETSAEASKNQGQPKTLTLDDDETF